MLRESTYDEKLRKLVSLVERGHHGSLVNPEKQTVQHRAGPHHANVLACNASLTKEIATVKNSNNGRLALLGGDRELYPAFSDMEHGFSRISLHEDDAFLLVCNGFAGKRSSLKHPLFFCAMEVPAKLLQALQDVASKLCGRAGQIVVKTRSAMTAMTPGTPNNCDLNTDYFRLRIRWLGDGQGIKELAQT